MPYQYATPPGEKYGLDFHQLGFFISEHLVDLANIGVSQLLNIFFGLAFFVFGDFFFL